MTAHKEKVLATLEAQAKAKRQNKLKSFVPYPKQREFFEAGATKRERMLNAGNQQGKTIAGAVEMAYHLTGEYPDDWLGRRFDRPIKAWACGISSQVVRDVQQAKLLGEPGIDEALGTGLIPKSAIAGSPSRSHGLTDAYDTAHIRHKSGGFSLLSFKSYEQGKSKFVGAGIDVGWLDEEPVGPDGMPIYTECLSRTNATGGMLYTTYTPVNGLTELWERFNQPSPDRARITMTIMDAQHFNEEDRQRIIASYAPHERDCRVNGSPYMGSGRVFTTPESEIEEDPIQIPEWFSLLWAIDPGVGHPFAAILLAWDREADVVHVIHTLRMADAMAIDHAAAIKGYGARWGERIPVAWPQDATQRKEFGGQLVPLAQIYRSHGLRMLGGHATFPDGSNSTEAGIMLMGERLRTNRLRVFKNCTNWFEEYRQYHRREGQIVKLRDDLMSATRVGIMALRCAQPVKMHAINNGRLGPRICDGAELSAKDLWG